MDLASRNEGSGRAKGLGNETLQSLHSNAISSPAQMRATQGAYLQAKSMENRDTPLRAYVPEVCAH